MRANTWRAVIPCATLIALPLLASCGAPATPAVANVASVPRTPAPAATATAVAAPQIGDTCVVGTWTVTKATFAVQIQTKTGKIVTVATSGGAGMIEHLFANGTAVETLAGTQFTGSGHGYNVVVHTSGSFHSPVVFINGYETLEPIDISQAVVTVTINGAAPQTVPLATYGVDAYTCSATSLTENDGKGNAYTYSRTSATP